MYGERGSLSARAGETLKTIVRSATPILAVVLVAIAVVLLAGWPVYEAHWFPVVGPLSVLVIAVVGGLRQWRSLPWVPCLGMAIAGSGYAVDSAEWMNAGFLVYGVLIVWHDYQLERPLRGAASAAN